ncbi:MAG TPA: gluconate 2-dehydrogenase subunit 3 family protein [Terriglobales bacterium]|nr:gluconate 2-dehydrogenase subunit 3 family protein [Terriglobales bacterium]
MTLSPVRPTFRAVACTVVPEANQLDEQGWQELETLVETTLRDRPPAMQRQLRWFLRAIRWLSVFRYGREFASLSADRRTRVLSHLQDHRIRPIRCGFWGLRTLVFLGFYGRAEAVKAIGYAADPQGWGVPR